jgi:DNA recombination protein RmuC
MPDLLSLLTLALLGVLLVVVLWRRPPASGDLFQQQLVELRSRLDALVAAQQELPRTLAEGSAVQARSLADVRERLAGLAESTKRLESVGETVAEVQQLLRVPKLRGTLGEIWLEELLRQVFPERLYEMQYTFGTGERVDAVLRIGDRLLPIDAKFPLEACQRMLAAQGDAAEKERRAFRRSLRARIDEIADRYVRPEEGTYDFAFMYVPAENVYYEAVVRDEQLEDTDSVLGYALERRVVLVSPNTFYAYLAAVLHGLKGLEVERRAREILGTLGGLEQQLTRLQRSHEVIGRHLDNAVKQYDESARLLREIQQQLRAVAGVEDAAPTDVG